MIRVPQRRDRDLNVHGTHTIKEGKLTFRTSDARLAQDCNRAKETGAVLTVHLLAAKQEFTGAVEDVNLISKSLPATWEVSMAEHSAKPRKRV